MTEIKKIRFIILCLLLVLVGGTSLFIGRISSNVWDAQERIIEMEEYAQASREEYIELSIGVQENFIQTIENSWEADREYFSSIPEPILMRRFEETLEETSTQAYSSMIVAVKDESGVVYTGYIDERYEMYFEQVDWDKLCPFDDLTIIGDQEDPIGKGNRLFVTGTRLESERREMDVFIFFEEQIMLDSLIETLSIEMLESTNAKIEDVLAEVVIFMAGVIALSAVIALYLRKIYVDTKSRCPYFGNELCHYTWVQKELEKKEHRGY